jgi:integrase/recombinase XerD
VVGTTLAQAYAGFLADAAHLDRLRPHTRRAYRYELALAAADPRFAGDLAALSLADLEAWIARPPAAPSTVGRRAATFRRFFAWAVRHDFCAGDPLAGYTGVRVRRHLPRPIREVDEQRRLDAAIAGAPQPYRLIFTRLRETGMRAGEALALRRGDVTLDPCREASRVREAKNGSERVVVLGPTATAKALRALRAHVKALRGAAPHEILFRSCQGESGADAA